MVEVDSQKYFVCGSKYVHMLVRHDCPGDVAMYDADRFGYAREIAATFFNAINGGRTINIQLLEDELLHQRCTAVFEYEDPSHAHVVPLYSVKLKFITMVRPDPNTEIGRAHV